MFKITIYWSLKSYQGWKLKLKLSKASLPTFWIVGKIPWNTVVKSIKIFTKASKSSFHTYWLLGEKCWKYSVIWCSNYVWYYFSDITFCSPDFILLPDWNKLFAWKTVKMLFWLWEYNTLPPDWKNRYVENTVVGEGFHEAPDHEPWIWEGEVGAGLKEEKYKTLRQIFSLP